MSALSLHIESTDSMLVREIYHSISWQSSQLEPSLPSPGGHKLLCARRGLSTLPRWTASSFCNTQWLWCPCAWPSVWSHQSQAKTKNVPFCNLLQLPKNILHISFVCWQYGYSIVASISTLSQISNLISVCHNSLLRIPLLSYVRPLRNLHTNLNMPWGLTFLFITGTFCTRNGYRYILLWRLPAKWKSILDTFINYIHKFGWQL